MNHNCGKKLNKGRIKTDLLVVFIKLEKGLSV